jgi:hypothetical protein
MVYGGNVNCHTLLLTLKGKEWGALHSFAKNDRPGKTTSRKLSGISGTVY